MDDLSLIGGTAVLRGVADVAAHREAHRRRRLRDVAVVLSIAAAFLAWRILLGHPLELRWPEIHLSPEMQQMLPGAALIVVLGADRKITRLNSSHSSVSRMPSSA